MIAGLRQNGLLGKAYFYVGDEPGSDLELNNLLRAYGQLHQLAPEVPTVMTLTFPPSQKLVDANAAWCFEQHLVPMLDEPRAVDTLRARGDTVWSYVCVGDTWPWPGLMIDDSLVGSRLLPWMQHALGYTGLLYWSTTAFGSYVDPVYHPRDPYADPYSIPDIHAAGDGFLLYPGKSVGLPGPVGSIRVHAIEGGLQDREQLHLFEQRSMAIATTLGVADRIAVRDLLKPYFDVLYTWIDNYRDDPALFETVRSEVGAQVDRLVNGVPAVVVLGKARAFHVPVTVYVGSGTAVTIAGAASTPAERTTKADIHRTILPLPAGYQKVVVTVGADTLTRSVQVGPIGLPHPLRINSFETDQNVTRLRTVGASVARSTAHPATGGSSLQITFQAGSQSPGVYFYAADIGRNNWTTYDTFAFEAYNDSDHVLVVNGKFYNSVTADDKHPVYLAPRQMQTVRFRLWHLPNDLTHPDQGGFDPVRAHVVPDLHEPAELGRFGVRGQPAVRVDEHGAGKPGHVRTAGRQRRTHVRAGGGQWCDCHWPAGCGSRDLAANDGGRAGRWPGRVRGGRVGPDERARPDHRGRADLAAAIGRLAEPGRAVGHPRRPAGRRGRRRRQTDLPCSYATEHAGGWLARFAHLGQLAHRHPHRCEQRKRRDGDGRSSGRPGCRRQALLLRTDDRQPAAAWLAGQPRRHPVAHHDHPAERHR
ncbi:glycoside hydrolase domain-containing protein [Fodinicola feengrottensis]|uniref:glycoside hydrolase domain-containing protein n=1 Tax=Fodinicola feengrottensis TaxID=435914 RepID=UPI0013D11830|nr:glycoside hydrolase domain-containing protein [Fodinicola feengrottensis]